MTRYSVRLVVGSCAVAALIASSGCAPPAPSGEALLYYIRNARVHGKVRRAWPAGQAYLDGVMKADAALQKELDLLRELSTSLWQQADPRWQDKEVLVTHLAELEKLQHEHRLLRASALEKLGKAIAKLPDGLELKTDEDRAAIIEGVWKALAIWDTPLRDVVGGLEKRLSLRLELYRSVLEAANGFDGDKIGLKFKDAGQQERIDQQYGQLTEILESDEEHFILYAERSLLETAHALRTIDKATHQREHSYLDNKQKYLRENLEALWKDLNVRIEEKKRELRELEKKLARAKKDAERTKLANLIAFCRQRTNQLQHDYEATKQRVDEILQRVKEQSAPPADSTER